MSTPRLCSLRALQPTQLYIYREKLAAVKSVIDFSHPDNIPPLPIKTLDGDLILTDGHTRAFAAFLAGLTSVPVVDDQDRLDWEAYRICVAWCRETGIDTIADLQNRVVSPEAYQELWLLRCKQMQQNLANARKSQEE